MTTKAKKRANQAKKTKTKPVKSATQKRVQALCSKAQHSSNLGRPDARKIAEQANLLAATLHPRDDLRAHAETTLLYILWRIDRKAATAMWLEVAARWVNDGVEPGQSFVYLLVVQHELKVAIPASLRGPLRMMWARDRSAMTLDGNYWLPFSDGGDVRDPSIPPEPREAWAKGRELLNRGELERARACAAAAQAAFKSDPTVGRWGDVLALEIARRSGKGLLETWKPIAASWMQKPPPKEHVWDSIVGYGIVAGADAKSIDDLVLAWKKRNKKAGVGFLG